MQGKVSALPQDASFDPGFSVGEQLSFYARLQGFTAKAARHESKRVLEKLALEAIFKERPSALSHGMLKRVAIAQALIASPELILLDEPTAGLDPVNTRNVRAIVADLSATRRPLLLVLMTLSSSAVYASKCYFSITGL